MSSTSKIMGMSVLSPEEKGPNDVSAAMWDLQRRRYLMRYVLLAVGLSGAICVAAGIRVVKMRSAAAQDDAARPHEHALEARSSVALPVEPAPPPPTPERVAAPNDPPAQPIATAAAVLAAEPSPPAQQQQVTETDNGKGAVPKRPNSHHEVAAEASPAPVAAHPSPDAPASTHRTAKAKPSHAAGIVQDAPF